jgi:plastocyanin
VASSAAAAPAKPLRIRQQGYQFRPSVAVVRAGTQVEFPNEDDEFHNVFSFSKAKRFDLGRYRRDELSPAVVFDKPGLVRIFCEIHQHMRCTILVVDTPHFTLTDTSGRFRLENVPAGEHRLKVLLPSEKTLEMKVVIAEGGTARVNPGS